MKTKYTKFIIYIFLVFFSFIAILPFIWVITSGFKSEPELFTGVLIPSEWRFRNYVDAWSEAHMERVLVNSSLVTVISVCIGVAFDVLAGYAFAKLSLSKRKWLFYVYILALAIPLEANVYAIYIQVRQLGLNNTLWGISLALIGTGTAFGTYMMRNFFMDMPNDFKDSARIDGASEFMIFLKIYLPQAKPSITALAVFKALQAWNEYNMSLFILTNQKKWTIPLAVATFKTFEQSNYSWVFASAVISFLPTVILYIIFNKSFVEGMMVGGIKG